MSKPLLPSRLRFWKLGSLEAMLGELGRMSCLETRRGAFSSTFRRRILRGGYIESPAGWSFDPSAEGAMTTARPPLSLIICPCLSLLSTDYRLSPCCHTLRRCSLTVGTLCLRREEWDHDPPAVTTIGTLILSITLWRRRLYVQHIALYTRYKKQPAL